MDEAQYLADRVAVIAAGRIVAEGTPASIGGRDLAQATVQYRPPAGTVPPADLGGPASPDGVVSFTPADLTEGLHRLTGWAIEHAVSLAGLDITRPSLEDVYLTLTGSQPDGAATDPGVPAGEAKR
jgi:ABC-2 type transport system ATP-binding protein